MSKYLIGMFIMMLMLKPMVGAALVYIFADGMQSAAAAIAEGHPTSGKYRYPDSYYEYRDRRDQQSGVAPVRVETEEQVHSIIEKRESHRQEQVENQKKEEEIIETVRGEQVGVELFDEEFNKKYPKKR